MSLMCRAGGVTCWTAKDTSPATPSMAWPSRRRCCPIDIIGRIFSLCWPPYPLLLTVWFIHFKRMHFSTNDWFLQDYLYKLLNIREYVWKSFYLPLIHVNTAAIFVALARPKSRGRIQLRSADRADHPIIDPRYYSHPEDAKVMLEGICFAEQVIRTPAMQKFNVSLHPEPYPVCKYASILNSGKPDTTTMTIRT